MKLLLIIVQDADAVRLRDALSAQRIPFTKLASTGGFLRRGVCTFLTGIADERVDQVKEIVRQNSKERTVPMRLPTSIELSDLADALLDDDAAKVTVGGATVITLEVEDFIKL